MNTSMDTRLFVREGDIITLTLPHSEVCMFMKVAGQVRPVLIVKGGAQILNHDQTVFSAPVSQGEAGLHYDTVTGQWYAPRHNTIKYVPRPQTTVVLYEYRVVGGGRVNCATANQVQAVLDRFGSNCQVDVEQDRLGRRYRVTLPLMASALLNPAPAVRLAGIAKTIGVPAVIED